MRLTAEGTRVLRDLFTQKQDAWRGTLPQTVSDPELAAVALAFSLNRGQLQRVYRAWKDGPNMKLKLRPASEYTANVRTRLGEQDALVADAFTMSAAAARVKMIAGTRDWMGTLRSESWAQVLLTERVGSLIELVVTHHHLEFRVVHVTRLRAGQQRAVLDARVRKVWPLATGAGGPWKETSLLARLQDFTAAVDLFLDSMTPGHTARMV